MRSLKGFERTYLRGLAHGMRPVVQIGKNGLSDEVTASINEALDARELIKIRFNEFRDERKSIALKIEEITASKMAGMIGNIAIFYKENPDRQKRRIKLPEKVKKA